jgi:hypothetical protein
MRHKVKPRVYILFSDPSYEAAMAKTLTYEETTRRPVVWLAEVVAIGMVILGLGHAAPWYFLLPVLFALVMCTWFLVFPRISGSRITPQTVEIYVNGKATKYLMQDIKEYRMKEWSDSSPTFYLRMKNGAEIMLPAYCIGPVEEVREALEDYGIKEKV